MLYPYIFIRTRPKKSGLVTLVIINFLTNPVERIIAAVVAVAAIIPFEINITITIASQSEYPQQK